MDCGRRMSRIVTAFNVLAPLPARCSGGFTGEFRQDVGVGVSSDSNAGVAEEFLDLAAGLGVALLAAGNAEIYRRDDVICARSPTSHPANSRSSGAATTADEPFASSSTRATGACARREQPESENRPGRLTEGAVS